MWCREHAGWDSPALGGRRMDLLVYGHGGARVQVFPTSQGSVHEWEDFGMMGALDEHLSRGWLQLFCVGSIDDESWYARWRAPHDRVCWHDRYDHYVRDEVLPFTASINPNPFLIATGASFGTSTIPRGSPRSGGWTSSSPPDGMTPCAGTASSFRGFCGSAASATRSDCGTDGRTI